jgi:hypothetical protein
MSLVSMQKKWINNQLKYNTQEESQYVFTRSFFPKTTRIPGGSQQGIARKRRSYDGCGSMPGRLSGIWWNDMNT